MYRRELTRAYGRGGIGQATAKSFARVGCSIAVHYNADSSAAKADTLIAELKTLAPTGTQPKFAAFQANLSTYDEARKLHGEVVKTLGNPDVLFSNHGVAGPTIGPNGDIRNVSTEVFEDTWRTNVGTHFLVGSFPVERRLLLTMAVLQAHATLRTVYGGTEVGKGDLHVEVGR